MAEPGKQEVPISLSVQAFRGLKWKSEFPDVRLQLPDKTKRGTFL